MSQTARENRVLWVERTQVLSMLLVVLHHCVPHGYDGPIGLKRLLIAIQYPALVCFFFTSALFASHWRRDGYGAYLKKRAAQLLIPYLCINLMMLVPRYAATLLMGTKVRLSAKWLLMSFLDPHGEGVMPHLWFLATLFLLSALLPAIDAIARAPRPIRLVGVAALLALSALPISVPTLFCLKELKLYLAFYTTGYLYARARGVRRPLTGWVGLALGVAGLVAFAVSLWHIKSPFARFAQMAGGLAVLAVACLSDRDDALTAAFRGKTYIVYILSMCVQNLVEVVGYSLRLPWLVTYVGMLSIGLAIPCAIWAWNRKRPLPRFVRLMIGL